jgi:CarD family transcriptional regulator, regulator of rRNA transcription
VVFKVGQKIVYPAHGVAIVEQIEPRHINGEVQELYLLRIQCNSSLVMVPSRNADEIGLRRLIAARQCDELLATLAKDFCAPPADWKDRFKEFSEAMRSGDLFAVAEVLKTLTYLNQLKPLSFREKQMLEKAHYLIVSEIAVACRKSEASVGPKVDEALNGACNKHAKAVAAAH